MGAQFGNKFGVCWGKGVIAKVCGIYPAKVSHFERLDVAFHDCAVEKMEPNGLRGVFVIDQEKLAVDTDFHSEFFENFSLERCFERLGRFNFSTRKLP